MSICMNEQKLSKGEVTKPSPAKSQTETKGNLGILLTFRKSA
jgi:hypothetical protein